MGRAREGQLADRRRRWKSRPFRAGLVRFAAFAIPIVAAVVAAISAAQLLPVPEDPLQEVLWWVAVISVSLVALFVFDRIARRLLPLAVLLRLSLVFPDQAPSRYRLALRSGSTRLLRAQVEYARSHGIDDSPTRSAEFILSLTAALTSHDRITRGHAERTRAYADLIGEELKLDDRDRNLLRWAALLHDIGKLAVAAEILNRSRPLNEPEWEAIKHHPMDGYDLAAPLHDFLGEWAESIAMHHERWDGSGYPRGIAADDIALGARIVSVADAYDAMTAARSYSRPVPAAAARRELATQAGSQFDPAIVRAFLNVSIGRLRWIMGPLAILAQLPFLGGLQRVGEVAGVVAGGVAAVGALMLGGAVTPDTPLIEPGPRIEVLAAATEVVVEPDVADLESVEITSEPLFGTAMIRPDGSVTYAPNPGYEGSDTFTIMTCTTSGACIEQDVVVTVTAPPLAAGEEPLDPGPTTTIPPPPPTTAATTTTTSAPTGGATTTTTAATTSTTAAAATTTTTTAGATTTTTMAPATTTSTTSTTTTTTTTSTTMPPGPAVVADAFVTNEDTAVTASVTANDPGPGLDLVSLRIVTGPTSGTAALAGGGSVTYTPTPNFFGADSFVYEICDTSGLCATAMVAVTVVAVNDAPVAVDDTASTNEDEAVVVNVWINDSDVESDIDPASVSVDTPPTSGSAVPDGLGGVIYTPALNTNGIDTFTYQICDLAGACSTATVTVTVAAVNDAPDAVDDTSATDPGVPVTIDVLANDSDAESDPIAVTSWDATSTFGGTITCGPSTCTYTPPVGSWATTDTFTYTIADPDGAADTATVSVDPNFVVAELGVQPAGLGDQVSQPILPLTFDATPGNATLPNYDADRNPDPGLTILIGPPGIAAQLAETDPAKFQLWAHAATSDVELDGAVTFTIWSAMDGLAGGLTGRLRVFLLDCPASTVDGTDCTELDHKTITNIPWPAAWEEVTMNFGPILHTVPAGNLLAIKVVVPPTSSADMWFAFGATGFESTLTVRANSPL